MLYMNYVTNEMISVSVNQEGDEYNHKGCNISAQERRQNLVEWKTVIYKKKSKK